MTLFSFFSLARMDMQFGDALADLREFLEDFVHGKLRQAVQLQFEDGVNLDVAEAEACAGADDGDAVFLGVELDALDRGFAAADHHADGFVLEEFVQILAGIRAAGRSANNFDDVVNVIESDVVAEQDVLALLRFAQLVLRAAAHHVHAVLDEQAQQFEQAQLARLPGDDRQQNHAERFLHLRLLEEVLRMICGSSSRFISMTMRMPSRSLSSRMSAMPSIFLFWISSAMCSIRRALLT